MYFQPRKPLDSLVVFGLENISRLSPIKKSPRKEKVANLEDSVAALLVPRTLKVMQDREM